MRPPGVREMPVKGFLARSIIGLVLAIVIGIVWVAGRPAASEEARSVAPLTALEEIAEPTAVDGDAGAIASQVNAEAPRAARVSSPTTSTLAPRPRTSAAGTRDDPIPIGEVVEFPDVWDITVAAVDLDAANTVGSHADINPSPTEGEQYVLISIEGTYLGDRVAQPVFEWSMSSGDTVYRPWIPGCGVVPRSLYDVVEVAPGESFRGQLCMPVSRESVADGLMLSLELPGDEAKVFELTR